MGIPIGWAIHREVPKEKDVLRADTTGQRSPIRHRYQRPRPARSYRPATLPHQIHREAVPFAARASHVRTRLAPPPVPEVSRADESINERSRQPPPLQREESSLRRSRSRLEQYMLGYQATYPSMPALTPGFAPAARHSDGDEYYYADYAEGRRQQEEDEERGMRTASLARSQPAHSWNARPVADDNAHDNGDHNAVGFPPLRRMGRRTIADGPLPSSSLRESWSPVSTVDGLGDRQRSISPLEEQPMWDAFLSTVVPDPMAPTAESSFASAAAAASFSNSHSSSRAGSSNSATSSRTHLTVPSRRHSPQYEQFIRACDTEDDATASDTEEEESDEETPAWQPLTGYQSRHQALSDAIELRVQASRAAIESRRRMRPSHFSNGPPTRDPERYTQLTLEQPRDASTSTRSSYNPGASHPGPESARLYQLDGPAAEPAAEPAADSTNATEDETSSTASSETPSDQILRDARALLDRLYRRGELTDEFWAEVGLSPSFLDRLHEPQEQEREEGQGEESQ